jgi:transcriptional regulator with XRE-family HTH domain
MSVGTLARVETGRTNPRWTTVRDLADALEVPLAEIGQSFDKQRGRAA